MATLIRVNLGSGFGQVRLLNLDNVLQVVRFDRPPMGGEVGPVVRFVFQPSMGVDGANYVDVAAGAESEKVWDALAPAGIGGIKSVR